MVYVNQAGRRMVGLALDADVGQTKVADYYTAESNALFEREGFPAAQASGAWSADITMRHADGSAIPVSFVGIFIRNAGGEPAYTACVARDISTQLQAAHAMAAALEQQKEALAMKMQFVTTVSHEFRTPLGVILSSAEILDSYDGRLPHEKRRGILAEIITSTRWMESLLENVLQLGRMESGKMACTRRPLDLAGLCSRIVDEIRSCTHQRCEISFITDFAGGLASADENLLRPILSNLLTNAVKYSPAGARVQFTVSRADGSAIFTVQDEGIGIPPEDQAHLFEGFHRGGNIGLVPGTGIGLVIVKRCVELHGGTITVESSPGSGTRATVVLPLFDDAGTPAAAATS